MTKSMASLFIHRCQRAWEVSSFIAITLASRVLWSMASKKSSNDPYIVWISQFYNPTDAQRLNEIEACFEYNLCQPWLSSALIFMESIRELPIEPAKPTKRIRIGSRLSFQKIFETAKHSNPPSNTVFVISNSDIYLTSDIAELCRYVRDCDFIALTRYEENSDELPFGLYGRYRHLLSSSQDTWILTKSAIDYMCLRDCCFELGIPGCDNALAAQAAAAGLTVWNPCFGIKTIHNHKSRYRSHGKNHIAPKPHGLPLAISKQQFYLRVPSRLRILR